MDRHERIWGELNNRIGEWRDGFDINHEADFPEEKPLPWEDIDEHDFPLKKLGNEGIDEGDENIYGSNWPNGEILGGAIERHGIEALAFYKSFRLRDQKPYEGEWGIFYLETGIDLIAKLIRLYAPTAGQLSKNLAVDFLSAHESYHYLVDILSLGIEPPMAKHLYLPYRRAYRYCSSYCVEEALANQQAWRWAIAKDKNLLGIREFSEDFMDGQPNAYHRYREPPDILGAELAANLVNQRYGPRGDRGIATWAYEYPGFLNKRWIPKHLMVCRKDIGTLFPHVQIYPSVVEIRDGMKDVQKYLRKTGSTIKSKWEKTKEKLIICSSLGGLDFKQWPKIPGAWSVRVDGGIRAHLLPISAGIWETIEIGPHDVMGH